MKNGLTTSLLFFWKMPKIWVGRTTLNGEKRDGLKEEKRKKENKIFFLGIDRDWNVEVITVIFPTTIDLICNVILDQNVLKGLAQVLRVQK